jgi:hypothetical protein
VTAFPQLGRATDVYNLRATMAVLPCSHSLCVSIAVLCRSSAQLSSRAWPYYDRRRPACLQRAHHRGKATAVLGILGRSTGVPAESHAGIFQTPYSAAYSVSTVGRLSAPNAGCTRVRSRMPSTKAESAPWRGASTCYKRYRVLLSSLIICNAPVLYWLTAIHEPERGGMSQSKSL